MKEYKFEIGQIVPIVVVLAVAGLVIAFTSQIGGDVQDDMTDDSLEYNATGKMLEANTKFADKLPLIATVIVAVILIGIIIKYFKGNWIWKTISSKLGK